jgi:integrase
VKGLILCTKCRKKMDGVCTCGSYKCLIQVYWRPKGATKGKYYEFRRDRQGYVFTYDKATDRLIEMTNAIKNGTFDPIAYMDAMVLERQFINMFEVYRQEKKEELGDGELSPEHYRHIESYQRTYLSWFDNYDVREIDLEMLSKFKLKELKFRKETEIPLKPKTRKNILNTLHAFFGWLYKHGIIKAIPGFPEIKNPEKARRRALTVEAQEEGINNLPQAHRDPIRFMMNTGLRPGELVATLIRSVDIEQRVVWVERARSGSTYLERTKNKEVLPVPLNDIALEIARRHAAGKFPADFLFVNPGTRKGYTQWFLWDIWKRFSKTNVTIYEATRHSYCSQIVPLTDKLTAQRLMRHKDGRSTDTYYHAYSDVLLGVVQRMANVVNLAEAKNSKIEVK